MSIEQVLDAILSELRELTTNQNITLSADTLGGLTLEELMLDSLETLQLAMNLEDRLGIELDIIDFPKEATINELAQFLMDAKKQ